MLARCAIIIIIDRSPEDRRAQFSSVFNQEAPAKTNDHRRKLPLAAPKQQPLASAAADVTKYHRRRRVIGVFVGPEVARRIH